MKRFITAAILLSLSASLLCGLTSCKKTPVVYRYDYLAEDLSQYIELADSDYKGYDLTVKMTEVTDAVVEEWILYTLTEHKLEEAKNPGKTAPLTAGDVLEAWYRPYIIDENGREIELNVGSGVLGASGVTDGKITIGGGTLPIGIESSLIGVIIADYPTMESVALKAGDLISESDVLYISYSLLSPEGKKSYTNVRIDLTRTDLDDEFGSGFRDALLGTAITEDGKLASFTAVGKDGRYVYENVRVTDAYPKDAKHITLKATLPHGYSNYDLACGEVYYDIFPEYFTAYDVPELNAEFIRDTLKISDEELAKHEGADAVEKYRAYMRAELIRQNEEELRAIQEEAMWYHYNDVAEVKSYPEDAVLAIYDKNLEELELVWESYKDSYPDFDDFARAYLSLTADSDWRAKLRDDAEAEVKEKLIFYYIVRKENLLPAEEKYKELFDSIFDEFVVYYMDGKTAEDYDSTEAYEKARADAEVAVLDFYGEDFFAHQAYYEYAIDAILDFAKVEIVN